MNNLVFTSNLDTNVNKNFGQVENTQNRSLNGRSIRSESAQIWN